MNITSSELVEGKLKACACIPAAEVDAAVKRAYKDIANNYRFQGFRKGKAPRPMIDAMFGKDAVLAQATNDLLEKQEPALLNELDIVPVKRGDFHTEAVVEGEDYTFEVEYKVRPVCELSSYDAVSIEMPPAEATEREIDAQVDMLMGYHTTFEDVEEDRGIEGEDIVNVDIENIENAESLEGKGRMLMMSAGSLPKEFDEALLGMKKGEAKEISWTPEAEGDEEVSASKVKVTVNAIRTRHVPELTDEFVKTSFGFDSIDAMRDAVKIDIDGDKKARFPGIKESRAVAALAERLELEEMDEDYEQTVFQELGQNFLSNLSQRGLSLDAWLQQARMTSDQFIADLHRQAADVARESLALDALAKHLGIEVSEEDVDKEFAEAGVENPEESKASFIADGRIPAVRDSIRRSKAVEWLVENAQVTEVEDAPEEDAE